MIQNRERIKKLLKFFFGFPLTIASFFFIARFIYQDRSEILSQISNFNVFPFLVGILFLLAFFLIRSVVWKNLLKNEGYDVDARKSAYLLASSEIRRYIPGSILSFVSRVSLFNNVGVPTRTVLKLTLFESILFVIASAFVAIPGLFFITPGLSGISILLVVTIAVGLALMAAKRKIELKRLISPFFLMVLAWVFYGVGNYLISVSFVYIDPYKITQISSYFVLSWLLGYLVLVVPMGLGIRESVVTFGLTSLMPLSVAASMAILTRIAFVIAEVIFLMLSYVSHRARKVRMAVENHTLILWGAILTYTSYFTYYSFEKHTNFFTGRFDLGNMDQTVWNTLNGRLFQLTNPDGTNIISRLAIHSDYILALIAPFYLIWEDPRMLLLIQTVTLALGAYFVFQIANHVLKYQTIALAFAISYLLNPFVQKQNLFEFHAVTLATTFLLAGFYYLTVARYKFFWIFLVLAVLTKENVYLIATLFGVFIYAKTKNMKWLFVSALFFVLFYVTVSYFIPQARGGRHFAAEYFQDYGESPREIISTLVLNPAKTIKDLISLKNISYIYSLLVPVAFASILSPLYLLFAAPDLLINLLSKNENLRSITFHYAATIIPFVYISGIFGVKRLLSIKHKFINVKLVASVILLSSIYASFEYGVLPGSRNPSVEIYTNSVPQKKEIKKFLNSIPSSLSVSSTNNLGAHLSHRIKIYTIPYGMSDADVVVFLLNDSFAQPSLSEQREYARIIQNNTDYIELARIGDFIAFAKRSVAGQIMPVLNY